MLKRAKSNLDNVEAKVLGVVLNNVKPEAGPGLLPLPLPLLLRPGHGAGRPSARRRPEGLRPDAGRARWRKASGVAAGGAGAVRVHAGRVLAGACPTIVPGLAAALRPDAVQQLTGPGAARAPRSPVEIRPARHSARGRRPARGRPGRLHDAGQGACLRRGRGRLRRVLHQGRLGPLHPDLLDAALPGDSWPATPPAASLGRGVTLRLEDRPAGADRAELARRATRS
ncbi:MAG: hypothetical protein MZV70_06250 [Desulfobacterales bacterium]|nr:hypothetical protein [Desulfobacterales bacterium]